MVRTPHQPLVFWMNRRYGSASWMRPWASLLVRPVGELREARAARTTRRVKIAHDHVIEQNVVQSLRGEFRPAQMRVDIQNRHFGSAPLPFFRQ